MCSRQKTWFKAQARLAGSTAEIPFGEEDQIIYSEREDACMEK